ncbi:SLC16A11 [Cordylochernes scorpioides]|uniref:SLC16A11 n=1 Tax=Cordylochernes scorpioides TaxID=51811 RepID=A0ABY6LW06_9ARAC|nr:SLC16A11 [Cordylochernes scorpioides]
MVLTLNPVIINQHFTRHRATAIGLAFAGASVGSIILPPATEALIQQYGLRGCFLLLGAINLQGLVGSFLYLPPVWINRTSPASEPLTESEFSFPELSLKEKIRARLGFLASPIFAVLCINYTSFFICYIAFSMTLVDFAKDRGISELDATFCISAFSVGDLGGRLASGWVSDLGFVKRRSMLVGGLLAMGILMGLAPRTGSYGMLVALAAILGLLTGSVIVLFPVLMTEYLGLDHLPMCLGFSGFVMGLASLCLPNLIGLCRDVAGSYDHLYHTLSVLAIFSASLWSYHPLRRLYYKLKESLCSSTRNTNLT